jgi:hypothetical protein
MGDWLETYNDGEDSKLLPGLPVPDWFKDTGAYKDSLAPGGFKTPGTWELLFMANLVDKNSAGLNSLLDDVLSSMFGTAFEDAVKRAASIDYTDSFTVDENTLRDLGVWGLFEGEVEIGRAELDLLFSAMRVLKASLQWISAYDWNTDVNFLKTDWKDLDIDNLQPASLPFRNNFLKSRSDGSKRMNDAKTSYGTAIEAILAAYDNLTITESLPSGIVDTLKEFEWIKTGLSTLKTAINNGSTFYVTTESGSYTITTAATLPSGALFGVNLGKFFTPGQFAINKLITTEGSGNTAPPQFFGMDDEQGGTAITKKDQIEQYGMIGFKLNFAPLKEVFVYGYEFPDVDSIVIPLLPSEIAEQLYDLYH